MKIYGKDIEPDCRYCTYSADGDDCRKKAEAKGNSSCSRFKYNPLLRKPRRQPPLPAFSPNDFKLDE